ncbi:hypothetical protein [Streptomyces spinosisporus]|uniref:Integral membrane protein n=1 Tax=Streptomyces spinosisporus TaxID=2927582 RepID=A0ABS9XQ04_9ACTN|nr:hypothetical protein [Streptomyces spinosisporus]MCI3243426.1 hypothetical protein [Streptomyces spinosisporus]
MHPPSTSLTPGSGATAGAPREMTATEHEEYLRLRHAAAVRHRRTRRSGAVVLLVLTMLLVPLALVAAWVHDEVADTGRYVQTVRPLASDPAVQKVLVDRLTDRVVANVDVDAVTNALTDTLEKNGARPRVVEASEALAGPLRSAVHTVVERNVSRVITSEVFREAWVGANRQAHAAVVNMLTGSHQGALRATGDRVQLDLGTVIDQVRQRLVDAGFQKASAIPDVNRTITLFRTEQLRKAQDGMRLLDIVGTWLPVLTLVFAGLTVWVAPNHRLMVIVVGIAVAVMAALLLVALAVVRRFYLDSVPPATLPPDAAAVIYDTFLRFLRSSARTLLVVSLLAALTAFLYGPGRVARGVRGLAGRGATAAGKGLRRTGLNSGLTGRWLTAHASWTVGVTIGAGALALALWNRPTVGAVVLVLVLVLVVLAITAVLAAAGPAPDAADEPGPAVT